MNIKRTNIPYSGRSVYGADTRNTVKRLVVATRGGGGGGLAVVTPTGTAECQLSVAVTNVYDTELPVTVDMEVVATVENQRVPTCVDTANITGASTYMSVSVTDNGTDHAVISVTLQASLNRSGSLDIPVMVNAAVGSDIIRVGTGQTIQEAFAERTNTTRTIHCTWEWNLLTVNANGTITRGPVLWQPSMARRFSNGQGPLEQDTLYMDLVMRMGDRNVYKCVTSYTQTAGQTWAAVSSNWQVDNSFAVIASGLILGTNGRIELEDDNLFVVHNGNSDAITIGTAGIDAVGTITCGESRTKALTVTNGSNVTVARITGSGAIVANSSVSAPNVYATEVQSDNIRFNSEDYPEAYMTAPRVPFNMEFAYITDAGAELFTNGGGEGDSWMFSGVDTHVNSSERPYLTVGSGDGIAAEHDEEYFFTAEDGVIDESSVPSGVYTTSHAPLNSKMYFNLDDASFIVFGVTF